LASTKRWRLEEERIHREAMETLDFMGLSDKAMVPAGALPYGEQRRIEIARALVSKPRILLLDEPAAGMNPGEIDALNSLIVRIRDQFDLTILLVEHQMRLVMGICEEILVLNFGKRIALGGPDEIKATPRYWKRTWGRCIEMDETRAGKGTPVLRVEELRVSYGKIAALKGISFAVYRGEIVSMLGANGRERRRR
jgi:ABC-type branched-subunit amino acid transport system ATPase component